MFSGFDLIHTFLDVSIFTELKKISGSLQWSRINTHDNKITYIHPINVFDCFWCGVTLSFCGTGDPNGPIVNPWMTYDLIWSIGIKPTRGNHQYQKTNLTQYKFWPPKIRGRGRLRHCARIRKVASSIPDGVIGILYWINRTARNRIGAWGW